MSNQSQVVNIKTLTLMQSRYVVMSMDNAHFGYQKRVMYVDMDVIIIIKPKRILHLDDFSLLFCLIKRYNPYNE